MKKTDNTLTQEEFVDLMTLLYAKGINEFMTAFDSRLVKDDRKVFGKLDTEFPKHEWKMITFEE